MRKKLTFTTLLFAFLLLLIGLGLGYFFGYDIGFEKAVKNENMDNEEDTDNIESFEEIIVSNPKPQQKITSPLIIEGQARGSWFFEAEFPLELVDENGNSLALAIATAQGEWMTEDFVPFTAELTFTMPQSSSGSLIIRNANPSDIPENSKEMTIPVKFN